MWNRRIKQMVKKLKVDVIYSELLDKPAHYIAAIDTIVIYSGLNEWEEMCALLHELGHVAQHKEEYVLYNQIYTLHSKMESQAEQYMIKRVLDYYLEDISVYPENINVVNFLENNDLGLEHESFVKEVLEEYIIKEKFA